jgi:glycine betaine/proline transport system ATP-binding protein
MLMSDVQISIRNLFKIFGPAPIDMIARIKKGVSKTKLLEVHKHVLGLNNVTLDIQQSRIHVIMGLSGSGKSTLIRHLNRLIEPTTGKILINGHNILNLDKTELRDFRRFQISMVFQNFSLFPHKTVMQNVAYGLIIQNVNTDKQLRNSRDWIERVGLSGFEDYYPPQLSGGMQQRVGLARALATDAQIILMDEPFSALDPLIRAEMQDVLIRLQSELKKTIVFITHDLDEALRLGDHIAILSEGEIIQNSQAEEIVLKPANDHVVEFTKNIDRGRVIKVGSIMKEGVYNNGLKIDRNVVLADAVKLMAGAKANKALITNGAERIGSVELFDILDAISKVVNDKEGALTQ